MGTGVGVGWWRCMCGVMEKYMCGGEGCKDPGAFSLRASCSPSQ